MTFEIGSTLLILLGALVLFVTDRLRMDVVALLVLTALVAFGLVAPDAALAGFSNPAVVTVWAMFILSAGLAETGVADIVGRQVIRVAGKSEPRVIIAIMLPSAALSVFMSNIGVAALMLPVAMDVARRTGTSPARLLMPMAFAAHLGGLVTLVGTPPNLVASNALEDAGLEGFSFFDFAPFGIPATVVGILFVAFIGRHLLPSELPAGLRESIQKAGPAMRFFRGIEQMRFRLRVGPDSPFAGRTLTETRLGTILGITVYAVLRGERRIPVAGGDFTLAANDVLLVQGKKEEFHYLLRWRTFEMASGTEIAEVLSTQRLALVSARVAEDSDLVGRTVKETDFARRFDAHILAIHREGTIHRADLADFEFRAGDLIQVELKKSVWDAFRASAQFVEMKLIAEEDFGMIYPDNECLLQMDVAEDSGLIGVSIRDSGLAERLHLRIVGIARAGGSLLFPQPDEEFRSGDKLLLHGPRERIGLMQGIQSLEPIGMDEDDEIPGEDDEGHVEVTLSPQSSIAGKSIESLGFRRRYGLEVLSIWRRGRVFQSHLRKMKPEFGDALLLYGPRERINELSRDDDFLVLSQGAYDTEARQRVPAWKPLLAIGLVVAVVALAITGLIPIATAAVMGAAVMVATGCLPAEKLYRSIDWKSVFVIACMLPLGAAMQETGAATWLAEGIADAVEVFGPWGIIVALYLVTMMGTTVIPTAPLVVIMASIGIDAAERFGIPAQMIVMPVAMAASASFASPISHAANALVMGPGGYRFIDYVKMGLLLSLVVMITVLPVVAWKWGGG